MKPLLLLFFILLTRISLFAQSNSSLNVKTDTTIATLCSNSKGVQGFLINKGNGQTEFQSVDQFLASKSTVQPKNTSSRISGAGGAVTSTSSSSRSTTGASAKAVQNTNKDSSILIAPFTRPPVLEQGPPQH
jgi:hypothetical protein